MKASTVVASFLFLATAGPAAAAYTEVSLMPALNAAGITSAQARGIAADNTVVGCGAMSTGATQYAWVHRNGTARVLGPGCATRINDGGTLAGGTDAAGGVVLWDLASGQQQSLGIAGSVAAVSDTGVVAGTRNVTTSEYHAFVWQQGQLTILPIDGNSSAADMNSSGQVVGTMSTGSFLYSMSTGTWTALPSISDANGTYPTNATAIDDSGRIIGRTSAYHNPETGFIIENGVIRYLPVPFESSTYAINNAGQMLGSGEAIRSFAVAVDGTSLMSTSGSNPLYGINDKGWIAGSDNYSAAVVWVPAQAALASTAPPLQLVRKPDFNGDGRADLLWRSGSGGTGVWYMNGTTASGYGSAGLASDATLIARSDFDGSGRTQVLWRNAAGDTYVGGTLVKAAAEGYTAIGAGDFNGDGRADILWWSTAGFAVTLAGGSTMPTGIASPSTSTVQFAVAAIADFDGDMRDDVLYRGSDGHFELWTMNGTTASAAGQVRAAGTGFEPVAIADFNADGRADIVWANPDGRQSLWLMSGALAVNSTSLVDAGTGWSVAFAADLNGDGRADLVWRHADGSQAGWLMDGTSAIAYGSFVGAGTGWSVAAVRDVNGDGRGDLIWKNTEGSYGVWIMDGLSATQYGSLLGAGTGWTLVEP